MFPMVPNLVPNWGSMNKTAKFKLACPGCELTQDVLIAKPRFMTPVVLTRPCEYCFSIILLKVSKAPKKGHPANRLVVSSKIVTPSSTLVAMKEESNE